MCSICAWNNKIILICFQTYLFCYILCWFAYKEAAFLLKGYSFVFVHIVSLILKWCDSTRSQSCCTLKVEYKILILNGKLYNLCKFLLHNYIKFSQKVCVSDLLIVLGHDFIWLNMFMWAGYIYIHTYLYSKIVTVCWPHQWLS